MEKVIKLPARVYRIVSNNIRQCSNGLGDPGSGAGRGDGERDPNRAKWEAAQEAAFFNKIQRLKWALLKEGLAHEVTFHKLQIKEHERALERHRNRMDDLDKRQK